jgi:SpoVK/Ycf46/Vps4 family AAA+-type ATPase
VFGTLLSWMATKTCPVFFIATANDIDCLPPALVRKGRFDELFWVDLPTPSGRVEIFNALLKHKFKQDLVIPDDRNEELLQASEGFSGAEIESVIEDALYSSLTQPNENLSVLLLTAMKACTPQSKINAAHMAAMREKAKSGYKLANDPDVVVKKRATGGRNIKTE